MGLVAQMTKTLTMETHKVIQEEVEYPNANEERSTKQDINIAIERRMKEH